MVRLRTLTPLIEVRILVGHPLNLPPQPPMPFAPGTHARLIACSDDKWPRGRCVRIEAEKLASKNVLRENDVDFRKPASARTPTRPPMQCILDGWPGGGAGRCRASSRKLLDARRGFEPRLTDSESVVLPLDDRAAPGARIGRRRSAVNAKRPRGGPSGALVALPRRLRLHCTQVSRGILRAMQDRMGVLQWRKRPPLRRRRPQSAPVRP